MKNLCQQLFKEIIALVIDNDKSRKILDGDQVDGFHTQFGILDQFNLGDAVSAEPRSRSADGTQVKATVSLTGIRHRL